jgi:hypothetical protein
MERPSKFDRAVQQRMSQLQDEPSARVWSGIRSEIGYTPRRANPIWLRLMVGTALVAGLGAAWYFLAPDGPAATPSYTSAVQPRIQDWQPATRRTQPVEALSGTPLIIDSTPDALPQLGYHKVKSTPLPAPLPAATPAPTPRNTPQEERFVEQELSPQQELKAQLMQPSAPVKVQEAEAINGRKRSIRLPKAEELTVENLKAQSVGLLPTLAQGASERLGIDTQYERKADESGATTTKFSLDLGLVKFKKVRKTQ